MDKTVFLNCIILPRVDDSFIFIFLRTDNERKCLVRNLSVVPYNDIVRRTSFMYNVFFKIKTI